MSPIPVVQLLFGKGNGTIELHDDAAQVADASVQLAGAEDFFLIVPDGLIKERLYLLVNEPLAHDECSGFTDIGRYPAASQAFGHRSRSTATTKEITNEVTFVRRTINYSF